MSQEERNSMNRKRIAVAFLLKHKEHRPAGTEKFFERLEQYDATARRINQAYENAEKSMVELGNKLLTVQGSIQAAVDTMTDIIDESILDVMYEQYIKEKNFQQHVDTSVAENVHTINPIDVPEPDKVIDIAGSTAKKS